MKNVYPIAAIRVTIALVAMLGISSGCNPNEPPSYISFSMYRSQAYYSNFAAACSQLITQGTNEIRLAGDDIRLPALLRDMHATYINATSSNVWVVVEIHAGYGVVWHQDDFNSNLWRLTIRSEAEPKDVLIKTNK